MRQKRGGLAARVTCAYLGGLIAFSVLAAGAYAPIILFYGLIFSFPLFVLTIVLTSIFSARIIAHPGRWTAIVFLIVSLASLAITSLLLGEVLLAGPVCAAISAAIFYLWLRVSPVQAPD